MTLNNNYLLMIFTDCKLRTYKSEIIILETECFINVRGIN